METKDILPSSGIWSVEDLAKYLNMRPDDLQQKLTDNGIKVLHLGTRYKARIIRLEDLHTRIEQSEQKGGVH